MEKKVHKLDPIVIIVEGCDLSGKGYLIQALSKKYPSIVMKYTRRPLSKEKKEIIDFKSYLFAFMEFINHQRQNKVIIIDRFYPSEMVYSKVKRGYEAWEDNTYARMERSLRSLPHLYIYCNPSYKVLIERYKKRGDEHINDKDIKKLVERYDRFFRQTKMNKLNLDTSKTPEEMIKIITNKIQSYAN